VIPFSAALAWASLSTVRLVAPGSPGGGWDQTARAVADALRQSKLVADATVINSPGGGGAIGLAQFLGERGKSDTLLVGGVVMITAIRAQRATVSLEDATPIARLTGEYEVIAVPAASDLRDLEDLLRAVRINPGAVTWGGGSGGGADQLLLAELARAIGAEPVRMDYVAFSGGGEVREALLANRLTAGISGYSELAPALEGGRLRALAISSPRRLPGVNIPTLHEQGIAITYVNWRGLFAAPGLKESERRQLVALVDAMVRTPAWREALRRNHWTDLYMPADAFARFLIDEETRAARAPDPRASAHPGAVWTWDMWFLRNRILLVAAAALLLVAGTALAFWQRRIARGRERELSQRLEQTEELLSGLSEQIEKQFAQWALTAAEREVAMLLLKGLRLKEIASMRNTSERTVRQQALTIYRKAGLEGRTDLAAFFLETLLQER
jgi:putative tricarboxylic transport membrane protein